MRGEYLLRATCQSQRTRFIPTCVGNTRSDVYIIRSLAVHPHMRGEYDDGYEDGLLSDGSSPHAWGIRCRVFPLQIRIRFIPTCVGNTLKYLSSPIHFPVHPHMRGEYELQALEDRAKFGSSPHAWGILIGKLVK